MVALAAPLLCLCLLAAGAAAGVSPTEDTPDDIGPVPAAAAAGPLPFLDYADPPLQPTGGGQQAKSDNANENDLSSEVAGGEISDELQDVGFQSDGLHEGRSGAFAELEATDAVPDVVEQLETLDSPGKEESETRDRSENHESDHERDTEFDHLASPTERQSGEHLPSSHTVPQTPDRPEMPHSAAAVSPDAAAAASPPTSLNVTEGGSLTLPCGALTPPVDRTAVSWYRSGRLLLDGGGLLEEGGASPGGRLQLLPDGALRIVAAGGQDGGIFTCSVTDSAGSVTEAALSVHVLSPPQQQELLTVVTEPANGVSVVHSGQPATLSCWAPGHPAAAVTWTKQEGSLPYGESVLRGPRLEIGQVDRTHGGTYLCTVTAADNRTVTRSLQLTVNFSPEVTAPEPVVHSGENHQAVISCQVFSHPPADVHWRRASGRPLRPDHHLSSRRGHLFSLTMLVEADDLDTYICTARNVFGSGQAAIVLTGRPGRPVMTSPAEGPDPWSYTLRWRAPSVQPLVANKLLYRQHAPGASRPGGVWRSSWREAVLPLADVSDAADAGDAQHQYVIRDLQPGSEYEARVLAQNRHGWSEPTAGFRFRTAPVSRDESVVLRKGGLGTGSGDGNAASSVSSGAASLLLGVVLSLVIRL